MIAPSQIKKPSNWQDFEKLCKLLWGEVWCCEDTIKRHGRQGQNQHGVDVYAYVDKYNGYCGIQCKGKDDYSNAQLTEAEIDAEIAKALTFEPELRFLLFATTANKDAKIEGYIRKKDVENRRKGLFQIDIASWEDIVDLLERYRQTYNWYVNDCQFKDATDVSVTFDGGEETTIHPEFIKRITRYEYKELSPLELALKSQLGITYAHVSPPTLRPPQKIDKRWCSLDLRIENVGSTVIRNSKLILYFKSDDIIEISDRFSYCNDVLINEVTRAQINASRKAEREVYKTYRNVIEYRPKESVFVQKDDREFSISVKPVDGITQFQVFWKFLCEDYQKEGILIINVEPKLEEKINLVVVNDKSKVKPDEIEVLPKIIEN